MDNRGFTLIELLVVLVVVGATSSFVGPNLWKQYNKANERSVVQNVVIKLQSLRHEAFVAGQALVANEGNALIKQQLPAGWKVQEMQEIYFLPSGVTNGGNVHFVSPSGFQWLLSLSPLDGEAKISRL